MFEFEPRMFLFVLFGMGLMATSLAERWLADRWLSLPIAYVLLGYGIFSLPLGLPNINPAADGFDATVLEYASEFIVIASLMGAGLALDRPVSWSNWRQVWPLLVIAMPLCIAAVAALGWGLLGLPVATALLLGAALAPTDPVLASSVSVGPPGDKRRHDVRFSLTTEAGLNDGLAFPFVYLAIGAVGVAGIGTWTAEWFAVDLVWRVAAGVVAGLITGRLAAWYIFERGGDAALDADGPRKGEHTAEGLIVLGSLLFSYGFAEMVQGYGFLAVFVAAVTARQYESRSRYHRMSHHFIEQVEKIVLVAMLFAFGAMLASGVLAQLTLAGALIGVLLVFAIRPLSGLLAEWRSPLPMPGKLAVAFLGVRGLGSIYYLAYGQNSADFGQLGTVWSVASFTILLSILVHGVSANRVMRFVESRGHHIHEGEDDRLPPADAAKA
ncbi:sodium:proton antiporter [Erythrobacteraceae bacterium CFH 75059]|uniref:cation:proton antiporter n=1 Tax=Qipengyuania thermophila TaxID=2509361 RepID=UPI00102032C5|nr:cation:proton antiporter [Qipengyuania thermophila]TCD02027.1 sodium:proton antiporter [Erythrobacteraceae bacterium CFH 75059]